jgi:hypothetical protein
MTALDWFHELIIKSIQQAFSPSPMFAPSESRCRWCPGDGRCTAQAEANIERARADFGHLVNYEMSKEASPIGNVLDHIPPPSFPDVQTLSKFELSVILRYTNQIQAFLSAVGARALALQMAGDRIPEQKLVRGRSIRKWKNEKHALKVFRSLALDDEDIYLTKMRSPAQMEQVLKAKKLDKTPLEAEIEKPEGEIKLAPITDKRPEVDPQTLPRHDFAEYIKQ